MRTYLFHLKDTGWIKEFQWQKQNTGSYRFFCSGSVVPQNHILFALSLISDMKTKVRKRMQRVKMDYMEMKRNIALKGRDYAIFNKEHLKFLSILKKPQYSL